MLRANLKDLRDACENHLHNPGAALPAILPTDHQRTTICKAFRQPIEARRDCDLKMHECVREIQQGRRTRRNCAVDYMDLGDEYIAPQSFLAEGVLRRTWKYLYFLYPRPAPGHGNCTPFRRPFPRLSKLAEVAGILTPEKVAYINAQARVCGVFRDPNATWGRKRCVNEEEWSDVEL